MGLASRLDVGMPVYNGARYLARSIETVLDQTFGDFTLWISDNGSTDGTADIARRFAAHDPRVRFESHEKNRGAAWNFNRVFRSGSAPLFAWAAADDLHEPTFFSRCVEVLEREPDVAIAYTATRYVDKDERPIPPPDAGDDFHRREGRPHERLSRLLGTYQMHVVFGVARRPVLAGTRLWGGFASADRVLVAEIALRGQIHKIEEPLFVRRFHDAMSWYPGTSQREYAIWYDPRNAEGFVLHPTLRRGLEYAAGIRHAGLPSTEEARCQAALLRYAAWEHGVHAVLRRARRRLGLRVPGLPEAYK